MSEQKETVGVIGVGWVGLVTAVAMTMQSATAFENPMPTTVSSLMRRRCFFT